ncbi:MAG: ABC transporter permease [Deferribacteraceae bacterium]|jgi:peptide/nickel transport system permease protein|nr:ABC transporter permease [Deferribacteraceae bacterium]
MKRLLRNKLFAAGTLIVFFFMTVAVFAPFIAPYDPTLIQFDKTFLPPSGDFFFGTDDLGRDIFSRMVFGARVSMFVGLLSVAVSVFIGTSIGLVAGYYGRWVDSVLMRFTDIMLCFPSFFLILAVVAFLKPSLFNVMMVIGLTSWMGVARLVRAETLSLRARDFIVAAHLGGVSPVKILFKHILPNVVSVVIVSATLGVAGAILTESALSFLGLGAQPPTPSWGNILTAGKDNILFAWWLSFFPGIAILITVLGFNLMGEGLRDSFGGQ